MSVQNKYLKEDYSYFLSNKSNNEYTDINEQDLVMKQELDMASLDISKYKESNLALMNELEVMSSDIRQKEDKISRLQEIIDNSRVEQQNSLIELSEIKAQRSFWLEENKRLVKELQEFKMPESQGSQKSQNFSLAYKKTNDPTLIKNKQLIIDSISSSVISDPKACLREIQSKIKALHKQQEECLRPREDHCSYDLRVEMEEKTHDSQLGVSTDTSCPEDTPSEELVEGVNCVPEAREQNRKIFKKMRELLLQIRPNYVQEQVIEGNSDELLGVLFHESESKPTVLLNLSQETKNSIKQLNLILHKKRSSQPPKFRIFGSKFSRSSRKYYASCQQPLFKLPPLFRNICNLSISRNPANTVVYFNASEMTRTLQNVHHILEVSSFLSWNLGLVAQHLRHVEVLAGIDEFQKALTFVDEAIEFIGSLGRANKSILTLGTTTLGNLTLKKRNAILTALHPNVSQEMKNNLLYSDISFDHIFPTDLVKEINEELDSLDSRRGNNRFNFSERVRPFRNRFQYSRAGQIQSPYTNRGQRGTFTNNRRRNGRSGYPRNRGNNPRYSRQ
ncbi:MAG: hypothetical protein AAGM46_25795 [Cyanobacteria bacterium J06582_2]